MDNLKLWNATKTVPKEAQKEIKGGRLKGMTDISPMWRYMELTKHFGPCGIGWKYTVDKLWTEQGDGPNVCAFALVTLYVKDDGQWSDGIPGVGGSMLITKESAGVHTSDECYKMAVTDALSVACKVLGLGADIYWMAGSKYSETAPQPGVTPPSTPAAPPKAPTTQAKVEASPEAKDALWVKCLEAAGQDGTVAEEILKICSAFTDAKGNEQFLTLAKLATASEKYVSGTSRNFDKPEYQQLIAAHVEQLPS